MKKNIYYVKFDVSNDKIEKLKTKFDIVIHAASLASQFFTENFP